MLVPIMTMYTTSIPMLLTMMHSSNNTRPTPPNASPTTPEYVEHFDTRVNLNSTLMENSVNMAQRTIMARPRNEAQLFHGGREGHDSGADDGGGEVEHGAGERRDVETGLDDDDVVFVGGD